MQFIFPQSIKLYKYRTSGSSYNSDEDDSSQNPFEETKPKKQQKMHSRSFFISGFLGSYQQQKEKPKQQKSVKEGNDVDIIYTSASSNLLVKVYRVTKL